MLIYVSVCSLLVEVITSHNYIETGVILIVKPLTVTINVHQCSCNQNEAYINKNTSSHFPGGAAATRSVPMRERENETYETNQFFKSLILHTFTY